MGREAERVSGGGARAITSMLSFKIPDVIAKTLTLNVVGRLPLCLGINGTMA